MKSLKFTEEDFIEKFEWCGRDDSRQLSIKESVNIASMMFHHWMTKFLAEMQSYTQGMSVLSEEPFKEFMKDFCEEWK